MRVPSGNAIRRLPVMRTAPPTRRVGRATAPCVALCAALLGCAQPAPAGQSPPTTHAVTTVAATDTVPVPAPAWQGDEPPLAYWDSAGALELPRVLTNYCEGESCGELYGASLVACAPFDLLEADSAGAAVVGSVAAGDSLDAPTGVLRVLEPGVVVLRRPWSLAQQDAAPGDSVRFAAGDTVHVLEYRELGVWTWWHRGHFRASEEFWTGEGQAYGDVREWLPARSVRAPRREWWVRFRTRSRMEGWRRMDDQRDAVLVADVERGERCS